MGLDDIVKKAVLVGALGLASLMPLKADEGVIVSKDEDTGIEYYHGATGGEIGYSDSEDPNMIYLNDSGRDRRSSGGTGANTLAGTLDMAVSNVYTNTMNNGNPAFNQYDFDIASQTFDSLLNYAFDEPGISREYVVENTLKLIEAYTIGYQVRPFENEILNINTALDYLTNLEYVNSEMFEILSNNFLNAYSGAVDILFDRAQENPSEASELYNQIISSYETIIGNVGEERFLDSLDADSEEHENLNDRLIGSYYELNLDNENTEKIKKTFLEKYL